MLALTSGLVSFKLIVLATYDCAYSEMSLEHFRFTLECSAATPITASTTATTVVTESFISAVPTPGSQCRSLTPPTKRRHFSSYVNKFIYCDIFSVRGIGEQENGLAT